MNSRILISLALSSTLATLSMAAGHADLGNLTVSGLNNGGENVTWTQNGGSSFESSGSGAFYGKLGSTPLNPFFCVDLQDWISVPETYQVSIVHEDTEAGWLLKTYGKSVIGNADAETGLQLAIWNTTYDSDFTVNSGSFYVSGGNASAIDYANTFLAADNGKTSSALYLIGVPGGAPLGAPSPTGQSMIATPSPAAFIPFLTGLIAIRRRKNA